MTTRQTKRSETAFVELSDDEVSRYLRSHPDFFERHAGLLTHLHLNHATGANTVSLIERQVALLRERNRKLDRKLRELIGVARANDALARKIHALALRLIAARNPADTLGVIERSLHEDLGSDQSVLILFDGDTQLTDLFEASLVRRIPRDDPGLVPFQTFLNTSRPRCGQIKGAKRELLFGTEGAEIRSAALIPLGEKSHIGFVAVGSRDATRFHPAMSTDFLARISDLIEHGLIRGV